MRIKQLVISTALLLFAALGTYFGQKYYVRFQSAKQERGIREARIAAWHSLQQSLKNEINQFKGEAGITIVDLGAGWEFSHNKAALFPSASLAKIPLMAACFLAAEQGKVKLERTIALKSSDKLTGSGVLKDMPAGTAFSVQRLIGLMMYDSDNTATNIITNLLGIDYVNSACSAFGLRDTRLSRRIADYRLRDQGIENYTTAQDMALLLTKIYRKELGSRNISDQCIAILKLTRMNDRIPKYLPPEITVAHKTGLERGVCHDAGIVFTRTGDFIIVVLTKHAHANSNLSKEFIAKVSSDTYTYFERLK